MPATSAQFLAHAPAVMRRAALLIILLTGACAPDVAAHSPQLATPTSEPTIQAATSAAEPTAAPTQPLSSAPKRSLYILKANFDYAAHALSVYEQIDYFNNSSAKLAQLPLLVEAENLNVDFKLIHLSGFNVAGFSHADRQINVELSRPLQPGETALLELNYELTLPKQGSWLGWTGRQFNFIDWYPYIPPYSAEIGWLIHKPWPVGEHLVFDEADFEVHIAVKNGPADLVIAAAAPGVQSPQGTSFSLYGARRFAWSASEEFRTLQAEQDGIPITAYVFPEHLAAGRAALGTSAKALALYRQLYGAYPYKSLAIVEGDFFDGMESDAFFFLDTRYFAMYTGGPQNYLTMLSAHETAHNWWYGSVGNDPALEPWLDEAFAIYSEELFYENTYPTLAWWWQFRIEGRRPAGNVNMTIYDTGDFLTYVAAVYRRGAQFLHSVRLTLGDETFFAFLHEYATQNAGRIVTARDFFDLLSSKDSNLEPLIHTYFSGN